MPPLERDSIKDVAGIKQDQRLACMAVLGPQNSPRAKLQEYKPIQLNFAIIGLHNLASHDGSLERAEQ
jgi:hypothetical protein